VGIGQRSSAIANLCRFSNPKKIAAAPPIIQYRPEQLR